MQTFEMSAAIICDVISSQPQNQMLQKLQLTLMIGLHVCPIIPWAALAL